MSETMHESNIISGIIHGKTIELDEETGLLDGQRVTLIVQTIPTDHNEGLKRAFGGWQDDAADLDAYLDWNRERRKFSRTESQS
jgi:hypothetical protein